MPKPIKKKVIRQEARDEDVVRKFVAGLSEKVESNFRHIVIGAVAVLAALVVATGFFLYKGSVEKKARADLYEGYKLYHGLYEAEVLTQGQRLAKALEEFEKSYGAERSPQALLYIANVQYAQGRYAEAVESLERLVREFPEDDIYTPLALYKAAMAEVKAGSPEEALKYLGRLDSLRAGPYKDLALIEAASLLESLGKKEEAVQKYETLIERYPDSVFAEEAAFKLGREKPGGTGSAEEEKGG